MRLMSGGLLTALVVLGFASSSSAQVERFGNTFAKPACGMAVGHVARCHAWIVTDGARAASRSIRTFPGYSPANLRSAYNMTGSGSSTTTVAIVDAYGYSNAEADLGVYRAQWGLPACTTANGCFKKVNQNGVQGSYPRDDIGWSQETALDLDMVSAMCPNCHIVLVRGERTRPMRTSGRRRTPPRRKSAHAISNSYGGSESGTTTYESAYNHAGIAVTASSGDDGYAAGPQFPATSPHVTAVGGTHLTTASNSRGWAETVWADAGSGCRTVYTKPTWQHDTGCTTRMEADVSAVADPNTGVAVYGPVNSRSSGWLVFGGTSVAAPLVAGVYGVNGGSVTYGSNPYGATTALYDVTSGSNGSCSPAYFCHGEVGYDGPTGLGTPNGFRSAF